MRAPCQWYLPWVRLAVLVGVCLGVRVRASSQEPSARPYNLDVGRHDWPQLGGSPQRNNVADTTNPPTHWEVPSFDPKSGTTLQAGSPNIKWTVPLGSQTYGNVVVANGRVFVGTNNGAGYLKRYPQHIDLGVLLCFRESDGHLLWQHSSEKLPEGRVHDWPMQGVCSAPVVEGNRLWFVTNRGEVVCLDTEGFSDDEDDGPEIGVWRRLFEISAIANKLAEGFQRDWLPAEGRELLWPLAQQAKLPIDFGSLEPAGQPNAWFARTLHDRRFRVHLMGSALTIAGLDPAGAKGAEFEVDLVAALDQERLSNTLRAQFAGRGVALPEGVRPTVVARSKVWEIGDRGDSAELRLELIGSRLVCQQRLTPVEKSEADVVWSFDMMKQLGVRQHNMATCAPTIWGDVLFLCTSNGVDETHVTIPAPDAPSFIALDKRTGKVLWTDNSPGRNILHGQWSCPAVGDFEGVPQVIFPGGDGWVYSFRADRWSEGKPELLWTFDGNPKDSVYRLGGLSTRLIPLAVPVIYDGLVYVAMGEDPEHGEGMGHLWCIDPTKRGDVSPELVVDEHGQPLPHQRVQATAPIGAQQPRAVPNPNSGVVWHYQHSDQNGNGKIEFEEQMHRSIGSPAIKNDLLFITDFSGLVHCLNAKTGQQHWTCDLLAACWTTPLIAGRQVYVADEDGEVAILSLSPDPLHSVKPRNTDNFD